MKVISLLTGFLSLALVARAQHNGPYPISGGNLTQPTNGIVYYVATNGNTATAQPNNPSLPYSPIFCDSTGTNFPGSGQAVDLALSGATIYCEPGTYPILDIHLHDGVTFTGHTTNDTVLIPTNGPLYLAGATASSTYSLIQPGNNCTIQNLNLNAYNFTNFQVANSAYLSWIGGTPQSAANALWQNVMVRDCFIQGAWDTFYGDYVGDIYHRYRLYLIHNYIHAKWDIASISIYADVVGINNYYYQDRTNYYTLGKIAYQGGGSWNEYGSVIDGFGDIVTITLHGCSVINSYQGVNHAQTVASTSSYGDYSEKELLTNGGAIYSINVAHTLTADNPMWVPGLTNFTTITNISLTNLFVSITSDSASSGTFGISNSAVPSSQFSFVMWTNAMAGASARTLVLNDTRQTNANGYGTIFEESAADAQLYAWSIYVGFTYLEFLGNNPGTVIDGTGTLPNLLPQTNSISTNASIAYNPSVFGGAEYQQSNQVTFTNAIANGPTGAAFNMVNTNWILGAKYSFVYPIGVNANACLTTAAVSGAADLELEIVGVTTNKSAVSTTALSIAGTYTNSIVGMIPANTTFDFTNRSSGSGDSATVAGGQYIVY